MSTIDEAIALASRSHATQKDRAGQPYILHPLRLMLKFKTEPEQIVAVLHDVVEDTDVTLEALRTLGFSDQVVEAVDCLTKRQGEQYGAFIDRIAVNALARKVKVEDIRDNLDLARLPSVGDADLKRAAKYHTALTYLLSLDEH